MKTNIITKSMMGVQLERTVNTNNFALNRLFTQNLLLNAIKEQDMALFENIIKRYLIDIEAKDNYKLISEIYNFIGISYRNEYFYKNTLLNTLLLEKHNLETTTALTEIPVGKSKADFVLINGKAIVYEIKTELDNLDRLDNQVNDYFTAFNNVCVVSCENNYHKLIDKYIDSPVGIYILSNKNKLIVYKEPEDSNKMLNQLSIFKVLHKREFERVLLTYFGILPNASQVFYYDRCFEMFTTIPLIEAYQLSIHELKTRNKILAEEFLSVPYELKFLIYFSKFTGKDFHSLDQFLSRKFEN